MSFANEIENFNASMEVTELLMKTLENAAKKLAVRCISEIANRHGFDAEKEIQALGLENLSVIRKQMAKKSATKEKKPREPKKSVFPMPFFAENVNSDGCQGLAYNRGLFTQCPKNRLETGDYCKGCQTEADKNSSGCPDCGNVSSRLATGLYEFKDPKGRSPISYVKLLTKLNITLEQVSEETGKQGKTIPQEHLVVAEKKTSAGNRGRPKKVNKVESDDMSVVSDLFSKLSVDKEKEDKEEDKEDSTFQTCLEVEEEVEEEEKVEEEVEETPVKTKKPKLSDDEKAEKEAKKLALETEKAEKKAALEAEKAEKEAKKAALETEKAEKKAALEAEKAEKKRALEAEKAEKKAALEAEKAEKKAALEAEKAEKKAALEAEKEAKKLAEKEERKAKRDAEKKDKKEDKKDEKVEEKVDEKVDEPTPAPKNVVKVTKIQISGKHYLKTTNNLLYNPETKEEVGIWDPETKTIKPLPQEEEEEEQEEAYDSN